MTPSAPGKLLAVEQAVILTTDEARAHELGREHTSFYLSAPNYRNNLLRLGYEEADLDDGGSDRLFDAIIAWGDEDAIRTRVKAHLDAGADHVCIQPLPTPALTLTAFRPPGPPPSTSKLRRPAPQGTTAAGPGPCGRRTG